MTGIHPDLFHRGIVGGGPTFFPPIITSIPASGPSTIVHVDVGMLSTGSNPALATTFPTVPPYIPGGSGPSMTIPTIPTMGIQPHIPPVMHGLHTPAKFGSITDPY